MAIFSLVYDENVVRIAAERHRGLAAGSTPLAPGVVVDGVIREPNAFLAAVNRARKKAGLAIHQTGPITIGLPESRVFTKVTELPRIRGRELAQAVQWQARQLFPTDTQSLSIDYQQLSNRRTTGVLVLLIATPRDIIDALWQALAPMGLVPSVILPRSTALAQLTYEHPHTPELLVDVEDNDSLNLMITKNRTARFSTNIVLGTNSERIAHHIEQAIRFYDARDGRHRQVANVLILPGTQANQLFRLLSRRPVIRPLRLFHVPTTAHRRGDGDEYLVNLGLLHLKTRLNLLPRSYRQQIATSQWRQILRFAVYSQVLLTLAILGLGILAYQERRVLADQPLQSGAAAVTTSSAAAQRYQAIVAAMARTKSLEAKRSQTERDLARIFTARPDESITILSVEYRAKDGQIAVIGARGTRASLVTYSQRLASTFSQMTIPAADWANETGGTFHLSLAR